MSAYGWGQDILWAEEWLWWPPLVPAVSPIVDVLAQASVCDGAFLLVGRSHDTVVVKAGLVRDLGYEIGRGVVDR